MKKEWTNVKLKNAGFIGDLVPEYKRRKERQEGRIECRGVGVTAG